LQMLTDHRLDINDRGTVFIDHFATSNIQFASGNTLIERMIDSIHIVNIFLYSGDESFFASRISPFDSNSWEYAASASFGIGGRLGFNPNLNYRTYTFDSAGVASLTRVPAHIVLAHELIHADRSMRGLTFSGTAQGTVSFQAERAGFSPFRLIAGSTKTMTHTFPLNEMPTIGISHFTSNCITENMIRREHGLDMRTSHRVR